MLRILTLAGLAFAAPALAQEATPEAAAETEDDLVCAETSFAEGMETARLEGEASGSAAACFLVTFPEGRSLVVTLDEEIAAGDAGEMNLGLSATGDSEMRILVGPIDPAAPAGPFALDLSLE